MFTIKVFSSYCLVSALIMKNVAYIRVSTEKQDVQSQKVAILEFCQKEKILVDMFREITISSRKKEQKQDFEQLVASLEEGDLLIVSELSRIGRSLGGIITQINALLSKKIHFIAIKENIRLEDGKQDLQSKIMIAMFGLFSEVERDLISQRTKDGLIKARESGKTLGRPRGSKGVCKLDGMEAEIQDFLKKGVSKASIAKILAVSPTTLRHFIQSRELG
jgi:DNA invertase Pin-like site-specific DNA recombinase